MSGLVQAPSSPPHPSVVEQKVRRAWQTLAPVRMLVYRPREIRLFEDAQQVFHGDDRKRCRGAGHHVDRQVHAIVARFDRRRQRREGDAFARPDRPGGVRIERGKKLPAPGDVLRLPPAGRGRQVVGRRHRDG